MKPFVTVLLSIVLLAAAETAGAPSDGQRAVEATQEPQDLHVNRHIDAHLPAQVGEPPASDRVDRGRRRSSVDPFRGIMQPTTPAAPLAGQPLRDRRY